MILILEASLCRDIKIGGKENFDQRKVEQGDNMRHFLSLFPLSFFISLSP
jgi:hypothetical protein